MSILVLGDAAMSGAKAFTLVRTGRTTKAAISPGIDLMNRPDSMLDNVI
jgi:hypothetical protein